MGRRSRSSGRPWRTTTVLLILLTAGFVVPGLAAAAPASNGPTEFGGLPSNPTPFLNAGAVVGTSATNEHNIISAQSPSSAIPGAWSDTWEIVYFWNQSAGHPPVEVSQAVIDVIYFGATIDSRTLTESTPITTSPGVIFLNASFSSYQYIIGGLYAMTASLLASNGSTAWAQSFYIKIGQPWDITVVSGLLIVLGIYEVYAIITSGKGERRVKPKPTLAQPPPASGPSGPSGEPTTPSAPGSGGQPYPSESPPPPGGS